MSFLDDLAKLSREEFHSLWTSGAFTGFTEQDIAEASETDREKMRLFNAFLCLREKAKRKNRGKRQTALC